MEMIEVRSFTLRDSQIVFGLHTYGELTKEYAKELGLEDNKFNMLLEENLIRINEEIGENEQGVVYELTKEGHKFVVDNIKRELMSLYK